MERSNDWLGIPDGRWLGNVVVYVQALCEAQGKQGRHDPRQDPPRQPDFHAAELPGVEQKHETKMPKNLAEELTIKPSKLITVNGLGDLGK